MSDETSTPTPEGGDAPSTTTQPTETKPDPKASLNEALKAAGVKLKAKDREYVPRDIDDLTQKASRVFGLETELESFKKEKTEAQNVKAWRAAIEADDEAAAEQAFEALSPKAQQNAAKWLQKKALAWEEQQKLPPEALRERERLEAAQRELEQYKSKEKAEQQRLQKEEHLKELRSAQESVLKTVQVVMAQLKVDSTKAPRALASLTPAAARHMRAAMEAEAETGVPVDPKEIAANIHAEVAQGFAAVAQGMDDDALYDSMGDALVKRLLGAHLKRVKGIKPAPASTQPPPKQTNGSHPERGTWAYFRK